MACVQESTLEHFAGMGIIGIGFTVDLTQTLPALPQFR